MRRKVPWIASLLVALTLSLTGCSQPDRPTINLYLALERGDLDQVKRHIAWDTDIRSPLPDGRTPLHVVAADGREVFVRLLLEHGADPTARDAKGHTPLETALLNGRLQVVMVLAPRGSALDANALLLEAARQGTSHRDVIDFLRRRGADLETRDANGDTPLIIAVRRNDRVMVRHLLDRGANPFATDAAGKSALAIAEESKNEDVARLLRRQGPGMQ